MLFPIKVLSSHRHVSVPLLGALDPFDYISSMGSNAGGYHPLPHILRVREPKVLAWRYIAQKIGASGSGNSTTNSSSDMVIASTNIGYQRTQHLEGCPVADGLLQLNISLNLIQGQMPWTLNHCLNTGLLSLFNQLPDNK